MLFNPPTTDHVEVKKKIVQASELQVPLPHVLIAVDFRFTPFIRGWRIYDKLLLASSFKFQVGYKLVYLEPPSNHPKIASSKTAMQLALDSAS